MNISIARVENDSGMLTGPPDVLSCSLFNPPSSLLDGHRDYVSCKLPTTHIFPVGSHVSTAGGARPACRVSAHTPLPVVPDPRVSAHTTPGRPACRVLTNDSESPGLRPSGFDLRPTAPYWSSRGGAWGHAPLHHRPP
ncbi:hypothetical protein DICA0_E20846 [Diutina catenulata]